MKKQKENVQKKLKKKLPKTKTNWERYTVEKTHKTKGNTKAQISFSTYRNQTCLMEKSLFK